VDGAYPPGPGFAAADAVPADEPIVYEDLFPVGAIPSDTCPLHDAVARSETSPAGVAMRDASLDPIPAGHGPAVRTGTRLFVDRVPAADGSYRVVIRQR
jgi:hypothetical protein